MEDYRGSGVQGRIRPLLETWEARSKAAPASVLACSHARPKHSNSLVLRNGRMDYRACLMSGQVKISNVEKSNVVESKSTGKDINELALHWATYHTHPQKKCWDECWVLLEIRLISHSFSSAFQTLHVSSGCKAKCALHV